MTMGYEVFLSFAHELADKAREITLHYFRQNISIERKSDSSPVTIADKQAESLLRKNISRRFPNHGIIGEEFSAKATQCDYEWIVDPIDGTKNFISGYPLYGTLICLLEKGIPVVSIIDIPALDERFFATADTPTAYCHGGITHELITTPKQQLSDAILFSTDYTMFSNIEHQQVKPLREAVNMVRYNGDCYLYAMLSAGWIDVVLEADLKIYDFLPLILIVEQSGGIITDWKGNQLTKNSSGQVLACSNDSLHQAALTLIQPNIN
ncbi:MAG: histidinol-phosphatase [Ostreibacterium sp.]